MLNAYTIISFCVGAYVAISFLFFVLFFSRDWITLKWKSNDYTPVLLMVYNVCRCMDLQTEENWMRARGKKKTSKKFHACAMCNVHIWSVGMFLHKKLHERPAELRDERNIEKKKELNTNTFYVRSGIKALLNVRCEKWCNTTNGEKFCSSDSF